MIRALALIALLAAQPQAKPAEKTPNVNAFVDALTNPTARDRNKPEREQWLQDNGFGMCVTWSVDRQLGIVISHSRSRYTN